MVVVGGGGVSDERGTPVDVPRCSAWQDRRERLGAYFPQPSALRRLLRLPSSTRRVGPERRWSSARRAVFCAATGTGNIWDSAVERGLVPARRWSSERKTVFWAATAAAVARARTTSSSNAPESASDRGGADRGRRFRTPQTLHPTP